MRQSYEVKHYQVHQGHDLDDCKKYLALSKVMKKVRLADYAYSHINMLGLWIYLGQCTDAITQ